MVKLILKTYEKTDKMFHYNFFSIYINVNRISKKLSRKGFQTRLMKGTKIFLKKKKTKSANMLVSNIEIFLKKKKKRNVNMVVNDIKIF